jgi:hypothetical protein
LIQIESRLWVAQRKAEFDLDGALSDLRQAMLECGELIAIEESSVLVLETGTVTPEQLTVTIASLSAAISSVVTIEFERRLRAYTPIPELLDEIADRYPATD